MLSGLSGNCCFGGITCSDWNGGPYALTKVGDCWWVKGGSPDIDLRCFDSSWEMDVIGCSCLHFSAPNTSGCPPATGWTRNGGDCTGGSVTVS